ncbi:MAG: hypothetical protein HYY06_33180 [Deltaproteobacteria bacterium]|nr:hypothetical protein [Deltaproteobacteria bacterium]
MSPTDLTVEILREIRDEIRTTNQRLDMTNQRLDMTNQRLDQSNQRLDNVEHALLDLAEQQRFVVRYMKALSERDSRLDADFLDLRARVDALESKVFGRET